MTNQDVFITIAVIGTIVFIFEALKLTDKAILGPDGYKPKTMSKAIICIVIAAGFALAITGSTVLSKFGGLI